VKFYKYHALGNDYIVMTPAETGRNLTPAEIKIICHRNFGIGSDGILWGPTASTNCDFALRIFNPDASEAEKSGNGLRIFSRYLYDMGLATEAPFTIETLGGKVRCQVQQHGTLIEVEMGHVSFHSDKIPVKGGSREVINETIQVGDATFRFCAATIGNPHCVILPDDISEAMARKYGPLIETDARFPNRTNVQFLKVLDRNNIQIEIWERGAGYTLASGSSSSAAAAVAHRLGLCDNNITVHCPGGMIKIVIGDNYAITMTGSVTRVGEGIISEEIFT
jgi:diaminopimelate epimerase